jgi:heme exporter protein CcmD
MSAGSFWAMGGYARFVWPCICLAIVILIWNLWSARRYHAQALKRAERSILMAGSKAS